MGAPRPERILIRGVNWLGDAVMTTPALQRLRAARPTAHLTLLTHEKLRDLWAGQPVVDAVMTFQGKESAWQVGRRLRREGFDRGLILPNSPRSALEMWFAGIPRRTGYGGGWRNWLLTQRVLRRQEALAMHKRSDREITRLVKENKPPPAPPPAAAHHTYQYLHLVAALGASAEPLPPALRVTPADRERFLSRQQLPGPPGPGERWIGLNAGAAYGPAKCWPAERFAAAAIEVQRRTRCRWLVFGIPQPGDPSAQIAAAVQREAEANFGPAPAGTAPWVVNLVGASTLGELCAGLNLCQVLLTNDSGPMHVAAAVGTPVVVPFGSTSPELTGPGLPGDPRHHCLRSPTPCAPCFRRSCPVDFRCMTGISVARVVEAVLQAAG